MGLRLFHSRWFCAAILMLLFARAGFAADPTPLFGDQQDFRRVVNAAKDKVFPAVVFIKCVRESMEGGRRQTQDVSGSGVMISPSGQLITNWHVVDKAIEIRCLLFDGRAFEGKLLGSDKDTDVALIQLKMLQDGSSVPYAALGDSSKLVEGDFVMAMGAPWGLSRSVSIGIVSCSGRYLPDDSEYSLWLQTDAAISPGNSGGPLVNTAGEVIGLNARGIMAGGDMGFAIPSQTILEILPQLQKQGKIPWTWTGLRLQPLKDFNQNMYFDASSGVIVADTEPSSPARQAGLLARDRLISINGRPVNGMTDEDIPPIRRLLALQPSAQPIKLEVVRAGKTIKIDLTPREKGSTEGQELDCPRWDFTVKTINQFENPDLFARRDKGVFVFGVRSPGNAQAAGLQSEDILLKIQNKEVATLDDVRQIHEAAIKKVDTERRLVLSVLRNGLLRQIVLDFGRDYSRE